ncbi:hypothetical protein SPRG_08546 [Saprolegnia parasitica CBS 223.65]|uniref:PX domain-containing protein n=1 Tax=Saprolegnia parasitica (strain CBS 223.65) TaxID=695850 RepID=A0A067C622_SAPPC|nr:hypothetical protein SPRG_08546 [Saprolegnia parasitica CBS 223.65]KDO26184.1 hypothetical protein SPRG_08546 [Saprolegnia parasitica CBS 223.65]|eukprot:XP_012203177.1 hypothetical protein SPRG_08546 [Saprolegnia parasitica CBS 223.65]
MSPRQDVVDQAPLLRSEAVHADDDGAPSPASALMVLASHVMRPSDVSMVQLYIVDHLRASGKTKYVIHALHLGTQTQWSVAQSYSAFATLRERLFSCVRFTRYRCPGCVSFGRIIERFPFPGKKVFKHSDKVVYERSLQLARFLACIMTHTFTSTPKCQICGGKAFEITKAFLLDGATPLTAGATLDSIANSLEPRRFFHEYCRSASKIECYRGRTIVKVVQVQRVPLSNLSVPMYTPPITATDGMTLSPSSASMVRHRQVAAV